MNPRRGKGKYSLNLKTQKQKMEDQLAILEYKHRMIVK
jgi:hypothetical protein